jgi:aminoglycoside 2'-N-acetyltransferase I
LSAQHGEAVPRGTAGVTVRRVTSDGLTPAEVATLRALFVAAFPEPDDFSDDDWQHSLGGIHVLGEEAGRIVSHASVVPRTIEIGGVPKRVGYVEAVATWPNDQRRGFGTAVMREIAAIIESDYDLGMLGTGEHGFYERLRWVTWRGPSSVRLRDGSVRPTPDEDGYLMALATARSGELDLDLPIRCEWRPGDVW